MQSKTLQACRVFWTSHAEQIPLLSLSPHWANQRETNVRKYFYQLLSCMVSLNSTLESHKEIKNLPLRVKMTCAVSGNQSTGKFSYWW